jgi:diguanylate cyclase (GGDEF)-like protein/PAS domain S-box-containing protein
LEAALRPVRPARAARGGEERTCPTSVDPSRVLDLSPDAVLVIDDHGRVMHANRTAEQMFGVRLADWIGAEAISFVHPDDVMLVLSSLETIQTKPKGTPIEVRIRDSAGVWRWFEVVGRDCLATAGIGGIVCTARDLTERRMWEIAASDVTRFQQVVQHAAAIILCLDRDGVVREVNGAFGRLLGHDPSRVIGSRLTLFAAPEDEVLLGTAIAAAGEARPIRIEVSMVNAAGNATIPIRLEIVNMLDDPVVAGMVVTGQDVTDLQNARRRLEHLASHDTLTGLPNRTILSHRLSSGIAEGLQLAVLYVDLNGFKSVNDTFGHAAGDELLRFVADRLVGSVSQRDLVARIGGDEFVVVAMGVASIDDGRAMAGRIKSTLDAPYGLSVGSVSIGASVGVVVAGPGHTAEDLLNQADLSMYATKLEDRG